MTKSLSYTPVIPVGLVLPWHQGKARDTYTAKDEKYLMQVASDRISTHNVVHKSTVPEKGEVLTMLTVFWLTEVLKLPHHLVSWGSRIFDYVPEPLLPRQSHLKSSGLHYRALIVRKLDMVPREFILRRYLTGSLLKAYRAGEDPYGIHLPDGLNEMKYFDTPIFTPTEKSEDDDPVDSKDTEIRFPDEVRLAYTAFQRVERHLREVGISLVDTKLEFGRAGYESVLADELFTPDSSRFVCADTISEGSAPPWLDKQVVRDEAERLWSGGQKFPLEFTPEVIEKTASVYKQLLHTITGRSIEEWRKQFDG